MADEPVDNRHQIVRDQEAYRNNLIARLKDEQTELKGKLDRLHVFLQSPEPHQLSENHQGLLQAQYLHMQNYFNVLKARIADLAS